LEESTAVFKASGFPRLIRWVCIGYFVLVLVLVVLVAPSVTFYQKIDAIVSNGLLYVLCGAVLMVLMLIGARLVGRTRFGEWLRCERTFGRVVVSAAILLFLLQVILVWCAGFTSGWDVSKLVDVSNPTSDGMVSYYSTFPNQLFLYGVFRRIAVLTALMGVHKTYAVLAIGGCFCVTTSILLVTLVARQVFGLKSAYLTNAISAVFIGLSPWVMVPYSDTYGTLCPALVLFFYVCIKRRTSRVAGVVFFSIIGYLIKPTAILVLVAVLLIEVCRLVAHWRGKVVSDGCESRADMLGHHWAAVLRLSLIAVLSVVLAAVVASLVEVGGPKVDSDKSVSVAHYLMMGSNSDNMGGFSLQDYKYSKSFATSSERTAADLEMWRQRVADMGPVGTAKLAARKTMTAFSNGTFAWDGEGTFFVRVFGNNETVMSYFGIPGGCLETAPFRSVCQVIWFAMLLGMVFRCLDRKPTYAEVVMFAVLVMLGLFLTVFEVRARYLFLFAPFFVMLGTAGWCSAAKRCNAFFQAWGIFPANEGLA
jgi:hypothetical protein